MKQITKTKPTSAKALKAMMQAPIGGTVPAASQTVVKQEAPKQAPAKQAPAKQEGKQAKKGATLYYFQMTPAGRLLRAYFVAFIQAQTGGKLVAGKVFKLWPACNIRGHLDTKKIERKDAGYALTAAGYNYFTDPAQEADKDLLAAMAKAIKSGNKPDCYKYAMQAMQV